MNSHNDFYISHTYTRMYTPTQTHTHERTHPLIHTYTYIHIHMHAHAHTHTHTHSCTHTRTHIHTRRLSDFKKLRRSAHTAGIHMWWFKNKQSREFNLELYISLRVDS